MRHLPYVHDKAFRRMPPLTNATMRAEAESPSGTPTSKIAAIPKRASLAGIVLILAGPIVLGGAIAIRGHPDKAMLQGLFIGAVILLIFGLLGLMPRRWRGTKTTDYTFSETDVILSDGFPPPGGYRRGR